MYRLCSIWTGGLATELIIEMLTELLPNLHSHDKSDDKKPKYILYLSIYMYVLFILFIYTYTYIYTMCIHISINVHFLPEAYAIISIISICFSFFCQANLGVAIRCIKNKYIYIYMHTIYMYIEKMNRKTIEYQPVSSWTFDGA